MVISSCWVVAKSTGKGEVLWAGIEYDGGGLAYGAAHVYCADVYRVI